MFRKKFAPILVSGCFLATAIPVQQYLVHADPAGARASLGAYPDEESLNGISFTLYENDSLSDFQVYHKRFSSDDLDSMWVPTYAVEIRSGEQFDCIKVLFDSLLYVQRWDTLSQPLFWQQIMTMERDTCLVSLASSREIIDRIPSWQWETWDEEEQRSYRDSLHQALELDSTEHLYVTAGKQHYYQFHRVLPTIGTALEVFQEEGVDPWYAQAILLIESPGALHMSPVGAYGSFQLMKEVALEQGLVVNDSIDEREDFRKAAAAAARHIRRTCVRPIRNYLNNYGLEFQETDLWFRLLALHAYHAGPGNVASVLAVIQPTEGGIPLMQKVWTTESAGFKNASQNYSQLALASMLEVDKLMLDLPENVCEETQEVYAMVDSISEVATAP